MFASFRNGGPISFLNSIYAYHASALSIGWIGTNCFANCSRQWRPWGTSGSLLCQMTRVQGRPTKRLIYKSWLRLSGCFGGCDAWYGFSAGRGRTVTSELVSELTAHTTQTTASEWVWLNLIWTSAAGRGCSAITAPASAIARWALPSQISTKWESETSGKTPCQTGAECWTPLGNHFDMPE